MGSFQSSSEFISISASGPDWRSVARQCVEALGQKRSPERPYTIGLLYVSEELASDVDSILTLLRGVTGVEDWFGCAVLGVFSHEGTHLGVPSLSMMLGVMDKSDYAPLGTIPDDWLDSMPPALLHSPADDAALTAALNTYRQTYLVGGVASARAKTHILGGDAPGQASGVAFSPHTGVVVELLRGWTPLHEGVEITACNGNVVQMLDGKPALGVMQHVMDNAAREGLMTSNTGDAEGSGSVHVAFPVTGTDQEDEVIRNIIHVDEAEGTLTLAHMPEEGTRIRFVYRTHETAGADMRARLKAFKNRLSGRRVTGAIYISCIARIDMLDTDMDEVRAFRNALGEVPLTGFYAVGEVARGILRGYSGVLLAFTKEEE